MRKLLYSFLFFISSKSFPKRLSTPSLGLLCVGMFFVVSFADAANFYSRTSGPWSTASTWSSTPTGGAGTTVPGSGDTVFIQNGHTVTVTGAAQCASITFNGASATLTINSSFNLLVTNGITLESIANGNRIATISGLGTIQCTTLSIGLSSINPSSDRTTTLTSTISNFVISGNLNIISTRNGSSENNSTFTQTSGVVTIDGAINPTTTNNSASVASIVLGNSNPILYLNGMTPFGTTGNNGVFTTTLDGTGATVNYSGTNNQAVLGTTYRNLTTSGSGTKTMGAATTVSSNLTVGSGTTLDVSTTNYALNIGGSFTNNGAFTPRVGTVTLNGSAAQSFNVPNFYNLTLTGSTKSFGAATTIANALVINSGASANLGTQNHTAASLTYGSTTASTASSWGSTASSAFNKNVTYFGNSATGILNVTCAYFASVNPITEVILNTLDKTSSNLTSSPAYEDFTSDTPTTLVKDQFYALTVKGNTTGYTNGYYTAYFDWNNNGVFTDSNESYTIGTINNSTGADGAITSVYLQIPSTAVAGNIKMRIVARMGGYSGGPCVASGSAGQIEEYTVTLLNSCSGNPTSSTTVSSSSSVCPSSPFTLSLGNTFIDGSNYVWQKSTDGTNWTNATPTSTNYFYSNFSTPQAANTTSGDITLAGGDCIINGTELILTDTSLSGHNSGFFISKPTNSNINAFTASFKYRIWGTTTGGAGADGMSFSYGSNVVAGAGGGENGEGDGIIIQFDTYDNEGVTSGGRVRVLYNNVRYFTSAINAVALRNASYRDVVLRVDANAKLSLVIAGVTVVSDLFLPGYSAADKSSWKFKFSARTGGENDRHSIDDLSIDFLDTTGSNSTFTTSQTVKTYYRALVTCGANTTVASTPVMVDVTSATITPMTYSACTGAAFTVTPTNGTNGTIPGSTTYTWTAPTVTAGLTGGASNTVAVSSITGTLINTTSTAQTATYTVTPITGSCTGVPFTLAVTVSPNNTISLSSAAGTDTQTKCINTPITNISYNTIGATGATFSGLPSGVTGGWTANVVTISGTPTVSSASPYTYTITLTGGCGTVTASGTITVNPNNTIALSSAAGTDSQTVCANTAISNITYATTGATGATFSGLPAGVTGAWAGNVVTISGTPTTEVGSPFNYTVTLTNGCGNISATGTITVKQVHAAPTITKNNDVSCGSFGSITLTGLSGNWTINQTGTVSKTYSGTASTYAIQDLIAGTYNFTITNSTTGCTSSSATVAINDISSNTTWNGSVWSNGEPDGSKSVTISSVVPSQPFSAAKPNIIVCSLTITAGSDVIIPSEMTLTVTNGITSNGKLTFESGSSLLQGPSALNTGTISYKRKVSMRRYDVVYWATPVTDASLTMYKFSPNTLFDKYHYWNATTTKWVLSNYGGKVMEMGQGYSIRGPQYFDLVTPQIFEGVFVGVPNNGDVSFSVVANKLNLIGNPYPSPVDADELMLENKDKLGSLYFWTHNQPPQLAPGTNTFKYLSSDFVVYNGTGSVRVNNEIVTGADEFKGYIGAGQAFFAIPPGTTVKFKNEFRKGSSENTQFYKTAKTSKIEKNRLWLNIANSQGAFKQILIGYIEGATNAIDVDYDAVTMGSNSYIDFYTLNESKKLTVQGRGLPFDNTEIIPLGYKSGVDDKGDRNFTISIDHADGFFTTQPVYLEDKVTGKVIDLRKENYTFFSAAETNTTRFSLRYTNKTLGTGEFENLENTVLVSVKDKAINITSSKEIIKGVNVYNIGAELLYSNSKVNASQLQIKNLHSSDQVLLVKITLENGHTFTKKVIFSNL
ncbi:hypothetical protein BB050_01767 [Flavobacterium anhuiense]|uniref:T9SS sorting signal type C domain-containing protein n=2 Tax=Flavobacterium anhuiense TaxID=459526 RepID=A0AAC9GI29_9FLAO|nr:hypothetical protein BB050_01767 [Flavobacterium anhuiense]